MSSAEDKKKFQKALGNLTTNLTLNDAEEAVRLCRAMEKRFATRTNQEVFRDKMEMALEAEKKGKKKDGPSEPMRRVLEGRETAEDEAKREVAVAKLWVRGEEEVVNGFYNYLLYDPRVDTSDFQGFLNSIFYIGKGKGSRALAHIRNAIAVPPEDLDVQTRKIRKILAVIEGGQDLGIRLLNPCSSEAKSLLYERSMIGAMGKAALTNLDGGNKKKEEPEDRDREETSGSDEDYVEPGKTAKEKKAQDKARKKAAQTKKKKKIEKGELRKARADEEAVADEKRKKEEAVLGTGLLVKIWEDRKSEFFKGFPFLVKRENAWQAEVEGGGASAKIKRRNEVEKVEKKRRNEAEKVEKKRRKKAQEKRRSSSGSQEDRKQEQRKAQKRGGKPVSHALQKRKR